MVTKQRYLGLLCVLTLLFSVCAVATRPSTVFAASSLTYITTISEVAIPSVNEKTNKIYTGNQGLDTVSVIDGQTHTVTTSIPVGSNPSAVGIDTDNNQIYVPNFYSDNVSVIDGNSNTVIKTITGLDNPSCAAVNTVTDRAYINNFTDNTGLISVIDTNTNTIVNTIAMAGLPECIAVNAATNRIYITSQRGDSITVIDGQNDQVITTIGVGDDPSFVAVNPTTNRIYATSGSDVYVIDGETNTVLTTITVNGYARGVAVNYRTNKVYVANYYSDTFTVIDGSTNTIVETIPATGPGEYGQLPLYIAVNSQTNYIYVWMYNSSTVQVFREVTSDVYSITGRITDTSGNPVSGATISIGLSGVASTDSNGYYTIPNLSQGTYFIYAYAIGYDMSPGHTVNIPHSGNSYNFTATLGAATTGIDYIALGDSVAAGHGLSDNQRSDGDYPCRRSPDKSYPAEVVELLEGRNYVVTNFVHLACSGATAKEPNWTELVQNNDYHRHKWLKYQVEDAITFLNTKHISGRKVLITITIGANDFGWTDPYQLCFLLSSDSDKAFKDKVKTISSNVAREVKTSIQNLVSYGPEVSVVVTGYHNPFNKKSFVFEALRGDLGCSTLSKFNPPQDVRQSGIQCSAA